MADASGVRVSAGTLRHPDPAFVVPHAWTEQGVAVEGVTTDPHQPESQLDELLRHVDDVAEIPRAVRAATSVERTRA